jgi:hypothetical protein
VNTDNFRHGNLQVFPEFLFQKAVHFPVSDHDFRQECLNSGLKVFPCL